MNNLYIVIVPGFPRDGIMHIFRRKVRAGESNTEIG